MARRVRGASASVEDIERSKARIERMNRVQRSAARAAEGFGRFKKGGETTVVGQLKRTIRAERFERQKRREEKKNPPPSRVGAAVITPPEHKPVRRGATVTGYGKPRNDA